MPFVHVRSLPQPPNVKIPEVLTRICVELAKIIELPAHEVCATWEFLDARLYAHGESVCEIQSQNSHPPLVDLLAFEGRTPEIIEKMIECVAFVIAEGAGLKNTNVFVNYREAKWNRVFSDGEIVKRS